MSADSQFELERRGEHLFWDGCNLTEIAAEYGTPLFVFSTRQLQKTYREIASSFQTAGLRTEIFFSFKTNPVPEILKALTTLGAGAEVVSEFELWLAKGLGLSGDRIVVNGCVKSAALLREAVMSQVALINVESVAELQMLVRLAAELDQRVNVGLRINPMLKKRRFDFTVSSGVAGSHIGFVPGSSEWQSALEILRRTPALHLRGLHFHIGSGVSSTKPYAEALDSALRTWKDLLRQGFSPEVLDIGGGFQTPSLKALNLVGAIKLFGWNRSPGNNGANGESVVSTTAQLCATKLQEFSQTGSPAPAIYVEPGRALVAPSALLLLTVESLVERERDQYFALCDAGALSISPLLLSENHRILVSNKNGHGPKRRYNLVGNLPTPLDLISLGRQLPVLSPGDRIAVMDTGAYFTSLGNNFAGPRPAITIIEDGVATLVRRRETHEDLVSRDFTFNPAAQEQASPWNAATPRRFVPARNVDTNPATEIAPNAAVEEAVSTAAIAFQLWSALPVSSRVRYLHNLRNVIVKRQREIVDTIAQEANKPVTEVVTQEVTAALEMLQSFAKSYPRWLRPRRTRYWRPGFWTKVCAVHYEPLGVLAVVGPTNYPFSLPLLQTSSAILCGNTVVLKPSERCPRTEQLLRELFHEAGLPEGVVEIVSGDSETVESLIAQEAVAKVIFTGKYATGRRVAELCGRHFKPCILELGGSAAAIVCEDANVPLAAKGLAWSALYANGDSCVGTKIIFVHTSIAEEFEQAFKSEVERLKKGDLLDPDTDVSTSIPPVVTRVSSINQAIAEANSSDYALSSSVWSRNSKRASDIARRLNAGIVWINDSSAGQPQFPWGGQKHSGWGRLFSREALAEITNIKVVSDDRRRTSLRKLWWFPYTREKFDTFLAINEITYSRVSASSLRRTTIALWNFVRKLRRQY
ncbi:MAG TPA: aldehyde dehydrogenase family protein [Pyrinomonadaceae bacterium]|nr:aldehyde dehydrogenase family protein [Pyrinomonadaceae bacterium]